MKILRKYYSLIVIKILVFLSCLSFAKEIKVMEIDTGLSSSHLLIAPYLDKNDVNKHPESYQDYNGHGTHVAGLIVQNVCSEVKLYSCNFYLSEDKDVRWNNLLSCYKRAYDEKMDVVNFSAGGENFISDEYNAIGLLINHNTTLIVAGGNNGIDLSKNCSYFPACYLFSDVIVVGNLAEDNIRNLSSNYGLKNMVWEVGTNVLSALPNNHTGRMTGTSMATAIHTNKILKQRCEDLKR